jgi:CDP-glycerol glycerophosphotransferase (TagB/SpsB family)
VLTVYSERIAQRLAEAGRDPRQIFVTGNPAFDPLASPHHVAAGPRLRAEKGIAAGEKLILWAEQPEPDNPDLPRAIRRQLAELCAARPGWRLIVRLHPSSTDPRGETIPAGALCSPATESLPALLYAVDAVVTLTSTVAMEGLLADKPVLVARLSQYSHLVDYSLADGAAVVDRAVDIPSALEQILGDTPEAAQLAQNRRRLPRAGSAAARVCDVVENHLPATART